MSVTEQALNLLDISPSISSRKSLENFEDLESTILASLKPPSAQTPDPSTFSTPSEANPFSVASRMSKSNYEDQAKAEALMNALRQIRANHVAKQRNSSRVLRKS